MTFQRQTVAVPELSEVPGMNKQDHALHVELSAEIRAINTAAGRVDSAASALQTTEATELTADQIEAARQGASGRIDLARRAMAVRRRIGREWRAARNAAMGRARDKAMEQSESVRLDVVKKMLAMGFVETIDVSGVLAPGMLPQQVGRHPRVMEADGAAISLASMLNDGSFFQQNQKDIDQLEKEFERMKDRVLANA